MKNGNVLFSEIFKLSFPLSGQVVVRPRIQLIGDARSMYEFVFLYKIQDSRFIITPGPIWASELTRTSKHIA